MTRQNQIFILDIEDLHIEAVLGGGFWGDYQFATDIHVHSYYELMFCCEGDFSIILSDGTRQPMTTGSVCLIPPGVYHSSGDMTDTARKIAIRFYCTRTLTPGAAYAAFTGAMSGAEGLVYLGEQRPMMELTGQLQKEFADAGIAGGCCVKALLIQLFVRLLRLVCKGAPAMSDSKTPHADVAARRLVIEEFFHLRHMDPVTEEDLAGALHISKRQLSRVLQQLYGSSFRKLLIDTRLSRAVQLLTTTELNAEEIASRVGYSSVSGFYDAFRKRYGISAGGYKQNLFR